MYKTYSKDDDYDYNGVYRVTHDEDTCMEALKEAFETKGLFAKNNITLFVMMMEDDRALLEDHVTLLFRTLPKERDLKETILTLAKLLMQYRSDYAYSKNVKEIKALSPINANKSEDEREKYFKVKIIDLYNILGVIGVGTENGNELKSMLEDAHNNPKKYLLNRPKAFKASLKPIEDFIISLKLYNRKDERESFLEAIKSKY